MPFRIDFLSLFDRFLKETWSQVNTKIVPNIALSESMEKKNAFGASPLVPNWVQEVQVGSKNRSKNDVKHDAETERLGNQILIDFSWIWEPSWPSKTEPRRSKIDVEMVSKFDEFLKASWNAIFSAQEAPRRASAADRRTR